MLTNKIHLYAVKYRWEDEWQLRASDSAGMAEYSDADSQWVYLETRQLEVDLPSRKDLLLAAVASLRAAQQKTMAEASATHTKIEEIIQSLLALPSL